MKHLVLIRHAKAEPTDQTLLPDRQRQLTDRGRQDAEQIGVWLHRTFPAIERFLVSPAVRTRQTAELMLRVWVNKPPTDIVEVLYLPSLDTILSVLWSLDPLLGSVALVGHNPSLEELRDYLLGTPQGHMPTCAVAVLTLSADSWSNIRPGSACLDHYCTPKEV